MAARLSKSYTAKQRGVLIGQMMVEVHTAAEDFARKYRTQVIANATGTPTAIAGAANPLAPTLAELLALGHLTKNITTAVPRAGNIVVGYSVTPAGCIPANCAIRIQSYINGPVLEPDINVVAVGVLGVALDTAGSKAGRSDSTDPTSLHGRDGQWSAPNPVAGNPVGIFAMLSSSSDIGMDAYVRVQDTRNPDLQGPLSVAGAVTHSGTTTHTGATTLNGATTVNSSLTTVGAAGTLAVGGAATLSGATTINNTANVTGRITAGSDVLATGMLRGDRLTATGAYTVGAVCADDGAIAKRAGGQGAVMCIGGFWQAVVTVSTAGAACAPNGSDAQDSTGVKLTCVNGSYRALSTLIVAGTVGAVCATQGQSAYDFTTAVPTQLICRTNPSGGASKWMRIQDITTHMVFVNSWEVTNGQSITKPTCSVAVGQTVTPILLLRPKIETSTDVGFNRYAIDNGASWSVVLTDASNKPLGTALGEAYCYYN
ncbi:methylation [Curvibacter sp. APW13]|uniref:methylation n=1 Tax=Curvibacter sp. APW13 TaxID=3077236 RepID=UPI0028E07168|nr:methylation [Curvibacter sp. APW13]MDT8992862.1 methylation [Curvibacter sp. APW13]